MILLKANTEVKTVFQKMINTMGGKVKWTEIFIVNNNDIILAGERESLFFNFDNRRAFSNFLELTINKERVKQIGNDSLLENTLNMILYAFGKWGEIKGLKVETNYDQLNRLLNNILGEIDIEANLSRDNFRFFKNGILITYEEVIQVILNKSKLEEDNTKEPEENQETGKESQEESEEDPSYEEEYALGLWHNIRWNWGKFSFKKVELTNTEKEKLRIGKNFYPVNYKCPDCGEKLYMAVYPPGKEFRIETEEAAVYMARVYTCSGCNHFYTPKPHKLLIEGDVYHLIFEDDKVAYEDYLELLGKQGERTANSNFNLYESEYNKKNEKTLEDLETICNEVESMSEEEISQLKDRMDSGFYPLISVEKYYQKIVKELKSRKKNRNKDGVNDFLKDHLEGKVEKNKGRDKGLSNINKNISNKNISNKNISIGNMINKERKNYYIKNKKRMADGLKENTAPSIKFVKKSENNQITPSVKKVKRFGLKIKNLTKPKNKKVKNTPILLSAGYSMNQKGIKKDNGDLRLLFQSEQKLNDSEKRNYIEKIERARSKGKIGELNQKVEFSKDKSYAEILRLIGEVEKDDYSESERKQFLETLIEHLKRSGEKELKNLTLSIPENINKKQHVQFMDKIDQYKEIDTERYKSILNEKRDAAEKQEIISFIQKANATNRKSLMDLFNKLKEQDFNERNVSGYLDNIHNKIYALDAAAIKRICPDPGDITFEEGIKMYDEISSGDFLPELKVNTLGLIDKRLKKIKMDECEQLVKKLSKDMKWTSESFPRIYFYDARKMMRGNGNDESSIIIHNALTTYAVNRGRYEYPILICDTSYSGNGKAGFVLTPDHIFYSNLIGADAINVMNVEEVFGRNGLFGRGVYAEYKNSGRIKISKPIKSVKLRPFGKTLNEFISYLKEKPESRSISYLAKEKHTVKCCYRCGHVYKGGNICPKCGSKNNE